MKTTAKAALVALGLALSLAAPGLCDQLVDANSAYERGDYAIAMQLWRPLAEKGNAAAQYGLGVLYQRGKGVAQNDSEAMRWFRLAAEQGDAKAQHNIGVMYYMGEGVPQEYAEAAKWFRKSAEQSNIRAQQNLGRMYLLGQGVEQNAAEALIWTRRAADQGDAASEFGLAGLYYVLGHFSDAIKWYLKSADQGFADAQYFAAMILAGEDSALRELLCFDDEAGRARLGLVDCATSSTSEHVEHDYVQAYKWYYVAAAAYSDEGNRQLVAEEMARVAAKMTSSQVSEAKRLAREWKPKEGGNSN